MTATTQKLTRLPVSLLKSKGRSLLHRAYPGNCCPKSRMTLFRELQPKGQVRLHVTVDDHNTGILMATNYAPISGVNFGVKQ